MSVEPPPPARRTLPEPVAAAVVDVVPTALVPHPHCLGTPPRAELGGIRAARRGSYRVLYRIRENPRETSCCGSSTDVTPTVPADLTDVPALLRADRDARRRLRMPVPAM